MGKPKGRPSGLTDEKIKQVEKLARLGATDEEVADFFEVSRVTIWRWKEADERFCSALKAGKEPADDRVERSLYARATGYECDEVDIRVVNGVIEQTPIRKRYPPDPTSCIFWLKNRRPDRWRQVVPEGGADDPVPGKVEVSRTDASIPEA
jgi:hypothetical protein